MKILIVGDQHFRYELPYAPLFEDKRRGEWKEVLSTIQQAAASSDAVVLLGDNLNSRHNHSSVVREFVEFLRGFGDKPVYILAGNHERYGRETALDFLERLGNRNWFVCTQPMNGISIVPGKTATFVPFLTPGFLEVPSKEEALTNALGLMGRSNYCFMHHAIAGASVHGTMVDTFNEIVFPREELEARYSHIFAGHIHGSQRLSEKTLMTGSIFTQEVGEIAKSVWVLDTDDDSVTEVPLPVRGIYKVELGPESIGATRLLDTIPYKSIVKCLVTVKGQDIEGIRYALKRFDASLLIEQYPHERRKVHFEQGGLDLSPENLLRVYAEEKKIDYEELRAGFDLIK